MQNFGTTWLIPRRLAIVSDHPPVQQSIILASNGTTAVALQAGTVLGRITASGKYVPVAPAASDGSQTAARVLAEAVTVPATGDETASAYRHGGFEPEDLDFGNLTAEQIVQAMGQLETAGLYMMVQGAFIPSPEPAEGYGNAYGNNYG